MWFNPHDKTAKWVQMNHLRGREVNGLPKSTQLPICPNQTVLGIGCRAVKKKQLRNGKQYLKDRKTSRMLEGEISTVPKRKVSRRRGRRGVLGCNFKWGWSWKACLRSRWPVNWGRETTVIWAGTEAVEGRAGLDSLWRWRFCWLLMNWVCGLWERGVQNKQQGFCKGGVALNWDGVTAKAVAWGWGGEVRRGTWLKGSAGTAGSEGFPFWARLGHWDCNVS